VRVATRLAKVRALRRRQVAEFAAYPEGRRRLPVKLTESLQQLFGRPFSRSQFTQILAPKTGPLRRKIFTEDEVLTDVVLQRTPRTLPAVTTTPRRPRTVRTFQKLAFRRSRNAPLALFGSEHHHVPRFQGKRLRRVRNVLTRVRAFRKLPASPVRYQPSANRSTSRQHFRRAVTHLYKHENPLAPVASLALSRLCYKLQYKAHVKATQTRALLKHTLRARLLLSFRPNHIKPAYRVLPTAKYRRLRLPLSRVAIQRSGKHRPSRAARAMRARKSRVRARRAKRHEAVSFGHPLPEFLNHKYQPDNDHLI